MIEELIKNARLTSSGRKVLTSEQKAFIVEEGESFGFLGLRRCVRLGCYSDFEMVLDQS